MYAIRSYYVRDIPYECDNLFGFIAGRQLGIYFNNQPLTIFVITSYSIHYTKLYEIDDDLAIRLGFRAYLEDCGYVVLEADNA